MCDANNRCEAWLSSSEVIIEYFVAIFTFLRLNCVIFIKLQSCSKYEFNSKIIYPNKLNLSPDFVIEQQAGEGKNIGNLENLLRSRLSIETKGLRLSVSSRSHSTFDNQKVSVSESFICLFYKKSCSWSRCKRKGEE